MREIKFRAWHKKAKKMVDWKELVTNWLLQNILRDGDENIELMQYTGLKDKNGKEVYEGDILKSEYRGIGRIRWGRYVTENEHNEDVLTYMFISKEEIRAYAFDPQTAESYEVIGNIYEDSNLLKEAL